MDRLISEKEVLKAFEKYLRFEGNFHEMIKAIPSAEPQDCHIYYHTGYQQALTDVRQEIYRHWHEEPCVVEHGCLDEIITIIDKCGGKQFEKAIPSAEPKTGHWIIIDDCEKFIAKCSKCGRIEDSRMISKYPYCHCGAKMVEEQEGAIRNE